MNLYILMTSLILVMTLAFAAEGSDEKNCTIKVQTLYHSGKKKLDVFELSTESKTECRELANAKQNDPNKPEDVKRVTASAAFRQRD